MKPWLLTAAMPMEARLLSGRLQAAPSLGGRRCFQGRLGSRELILLLTGMGMVNAAQAVTAALESLGPVAGVINLGCAGAYAKAGLELGQAAVAEAMIFADQGVATSRRLHGLEKISIPLLERPGRKPIYNRLPVDRELSQELSAGDLPQGAFATVGQVSGDASVASAVEQRWGAILEEMEGAAVAQVALHYGAPFAAVRGVSNQAGDRELDVLAGAEAAQRVILAWAGVEESA